ncbi:hypothetical protein [Hephaestia mangrovi]|uniref:hypothetical protein n=1 Tax=Hephaestia mangrovi TaxID=2873268 RepID=UPI001CA7AE70|nr:hypothetical protein [Hephaestia mangrovi]MBY8827866.1 hypothetical protein [Hephaestia mangrovi]
MSKYQDDPAPPESAAERAEAKAEAAKARRRWLTLAEIVAIAGVVIAGLTLWNNWQGREADQQARALEAASQASAARTGALVTFTATPKDDGGRLVLDDAAHRIQGIEVRFPTALGISPQSSTLHPEIDADWFEGALLKAIAGGPADQQGRLPVLITADYWDGEQHLSDSAVYDIVWATHGRLLRGRALELRGIVLVRRTGATQAAVDRHWSKIKPRA